MFYIINYKLGIKDIKEISSNITKLIAYFGLPRMVRSLDKIEATAKIVQEVMQSIKDPKMVKNIENIQLTSQAMQNSSERMKKVGSELKSTGIIDETTEMITSIKNTMMNSFGTNGSNKNQDIKELPKSFKDVVQSFKGLIEELKIISK